MPAPSLSDILLCASTGVRSDDMTLFDVLRAQQMQGGGYPETTITGVPPISFKADGTPLIAWNILANMVQTGTPSPDNIIIPQEFGDLVTSGDHAGEYAIPITCGATHTVYLSEPLRKIEEYADKAESTGAATREIYELILTGDESFVYNNGMQRFVVTSNLYKRVREKIAVCSHYEAVANQSAASLANNQLTFLVSGSGNNYMYIRDTRFDNADDFKAYLAAQYSAGTPVTVWYVLATPTTEQFTVPEISTVRGSNTMTVDTTLQPTSVSVTGHIKQS